jgi:hypothetical protein
MAIHPGETDRRAMTSPDPSVQHEDNRQHGGQVKPTMYRICVRGQLTARLASAFEGMTLEPGATKTNLVGEIQDQSHLYGLLDRVRELGLELISVQPLATPGMPGTDTSQ